MWVTKGTCINDRVTSDEKSICNRQGVLIAQTGDRIKGEIQKDK